MPGPLEALNAPGGRIDRLVNRAIWRFAGPRKRVGTQRPLVSFTFDDVPDSALHAGATILERHGVRGTFYIAGSLAGRVEPQRTLISADGTRELAARGHEIGCHSFSHRRIRDIPGAELADDLDRNAAFFAAAGVDAGPANFAFPYNSAWPPARREFRRRFRSCRGGGEAINRGLVDPLMLKAVEIRQPEQHARTLTQRIDDLAGDPGWLIFVTHDVSEQPTPFGCTPATFDRLVGHAIERGCDVVTVDAALDRLGW